ncbi:PREDICTED: uncharacterized protein LOC108379900, partial [Rhagoletis zephyria]|uniref:uncharacterized protein LOC108379900 n=1 Tax=Rhagoletis zephyria TaxID=28612 RepID=UPI0008114FC8
MDRNIYNITIVTNSNANTSGPSTTLESTVGKDKLCLLVKSYGCLYDPNDPFFNSNREKMNAWESIANNLGKSVSECKECWKTIRTGYKRYIEKCKANPNIQPYYLAEHLTFLEPFVRREATKGEVLVKKNIQTWRKRKHLTSTTAITNTNVKTKGSIKDYFIIPPKRSCLGNTEIVNNNKELDNAPSTSAAATVTRSEATEPRAATTLEAAAIATTEATKLQFIANHENVNNNEQDNFTPISDEEWAAAVRAMETIQTITDSRSATTAKDAPATKKSKYQDNENKIQSDDKRFLENISEAMKKMNDRSK